MQNSWGLNKKKFCLLTSLVYLECLPIEVLLRDNNILEEFFTPTWVNQRRDREKI